jgi:hypothetical protein
LRLVIRGRSRSVFRTRGGRARVLSILLLLTGCAESDELVRFQTDPYILRGAWVAKNDRGGLVADFDLRATYVDGERYAVSGSVTFAGEDPVSLQGEVIGIRVKYLAPQTSVVPNGELFYATTAGQNPRYLSLFALSPRKLGGSPVFEFGGSVRPADLVEPDEDEYTLCREALECFDITLTRPVPLP